MYIRHETKLWEKFDGMQRTMVVGGLGTDGGKESATNGLKDKCSGIANCEPAEIFAKGDFKGMLFAKFPTKNQRNSSIRKLRDASPSRNHNRTWFSEDVPVEE
eukprot:7089447-Karenia_brevis.AAC.1